MFLGQSSCRGWEFGTISISLGLDGLRSDFGWDELPRVEGRWCEIILILSEAMFWCTQVLIYIHSTEIPLSVDVAKRTRSHSKCSSLPGICAEATKDPISRKVHTSRRSTSIVGYSMIDDMIASFESFPHWLIKLPDIQYISVHISSSISCHIIPYVYAHVRTYHDTYVCVRIYGV